MALQVHGQGCSMWQWQADATCEVAVDLYTSSGVCLLTG